MGVADLAADTAVVDAGSEETSMPRKHTASFIIRSGGVGTHVIPEFSDVELTHDVEYRGISYPKGTLGVVVHKHDENAYEVEFAHPAYSVITLRKEDIAIT